MATASRIRATVDDLLKVDGKAELIDGRIVRFMPTGFTPSQVAGRIYRRLSEHVDGLGVGFTFTNGMGFLVPELSSGRESFSPDVSYYVGAPPEDGGDFVLGAPTFAVEVRSKSDRGPAAERAMAAKRADYFAAGTLVVWDVEYEAELIHAFRGAESNVTTFRRGDVADAEPAVPGWTVAVDAIFG
jgi:Uma2 family endonuclease